MTVVILTRVTGFLLFVLGIGAYIGTDRTSITALAPAVPGLVIGILGVLAWREDRRQTMVRAALAVAALSIVASLMQLADLPALLAGDEVSNPAAVITSGFMALLCVIYLVVGIASRAGNQT